MAFDSLEDIIAKLARKRFRLVLSAQVENRNYQFLETDLECAMVITENNNSAEYTGEKFNLHDKETHEYRKYKRILERVKGAASQTAIQSHSQEAIPSSQHSPQERQHY